MTLETQRCIPCSEGAAPLTDAQEDTLMDKVNGWNLHREGVHKISKNFQFENFRESISFVNGVAGIAEAENHHPDIRIEYSRVQIILYTHKIKGLHENDFVLAAKIDKLASSI